MCDLMRKKGRKKERENNEKKKVGVGGKVRLIMAFVEPILAFKVGVGGKVRLIMAFVGPIVAFYKCHYRFL